MADWAYPSRSPARRNERSRAMAASAAKWRISIPSHPSRIPTGATPPVPPLLNADHSRTVGQLARPVHSGGSQPEAQGGRTELAGADVRACAAEAVREVRDWRTFVYPRAPGRQGVTGTPCCEDRLAADTMRLGPGDAGHVDDPVVQVVVEVRVAGARRRLVQDAVVPGRRNEKD